jgi:integrase
MAKGVGLRLLSRRGSWVQIPPSAPEAHLWKLIESDFLNFGLWLKFTKGNRDSTIARKLRFFAKLSGTPSEMTNQLLNSSWCDKSKSNCLDAIAQYAEFKKISYFRPHFRAYDNEEMFVPNPDMVKRFVYRIRSIPNKAMVMLSIETGCSSGEAWSLEWKAINFSTKSVTITGNKGHRTKTYSLSDELIGLLIRLPKEDKRIFSNVNKPTGINDSIVDYRVRLADETGNQDFLKVHFHTFRHYAISWHYFKTKDIVDTQRFARHCDIKNTLRYVHIVKSWIRSNEYDVVYAENKEELTKYLSEGFSLVTKTDWGYCLNKPKTLY